MSFLPMALAAALLAGPTTLEASGVQVTLQLDGFRQDLGAGLLHDAYYRLGQFSIASKDAQPLVVSVLVDDVPAFVDLERLRAHVLRDHDPKPDVVATSSPPGFWFTYRQRVAEGLHQWHLYFHTLHEGKWIELHFSSVSSSPRIDAAPLEKLALEVIRSVRVARLPRRS